MTQEALLTLLLKAALISGFASLAGWVVLYTVLAPWYKDPIGRTLVAKTSLVACTFLVIALGAFFPWFGEHPLVTGWIDFALIGGVTPVMWWRSAVWVRLHRAGKLHQDDSDGEGQA